MADDSRGHRGNRWLLVKLHLLPSVENPPHQLYFKTVALLSRQSLRQQGEASPIKHQKRPLQWKHKWGGPCQSLQPLFSVTVATTHSFHAIHSFFMRHSRWSKMCHLFCSWHVQTTELPYNAAHNGAVCEKVLWYGNMLRTHVMNRHYGARNTTNTSSAHAVLWTFKASFYVPLMFEWHVLITLYMKDICDINLKTIFTLSHCQNVCSKTWISGFLFYSPKHSLAHNIESLKSI